MSPLLRLSDPGGVAGPERQQLVHSRDDMVPSAFRQYGADLWRTPRR